MKKNEDIYGRIYGILNDINDKIYIGQTIQTINARWAEHKHDSLKRNRKTAIGNAIRKYGEEHFYITLIEDNIPYEELDKKEIYYIEKYNSVCPNGYNISYGGSGFVSDKERERMSQRVSGENNPMYGHYGELNPFYGREHTEETKEILSKKGKERWNNISEEEQAIQIERLDEMRDKMIDMYGGGFAGKSHSEKSKEKIREKLKGRIFTEEHSKKISENSSRKQKVVMLDKEGNYISEFDSMKRACDYLKYNNIHNNPKSGEISNVCLKKRNTAYGYIWVYYNDYIDGNYIIKTKYRKENNVVICLNNKQIFYSFESAGKFANINSAGVWSCCNKKQKSSGKLEDGTPLKWMYYDEYLELYKEITEEAM